MNFKGTTNRIFFFVTPQQKFSKFFYPSTKGKKKINIKGMNKDNRNFQKNWRPGMATKGRNFGHHMSVWLLSYLSNATKGSKEPVSFI